MPICRSRLQPSSRWFSARYMIPGVPLATPPRSLPGLVRRYAHPSYVRAAATNARSPDDNVLAGPSRPGPEPPHQPANVPVTASFAERLNNAPLRPHPPELSVVVTPILPSPRMTSLKTSKHRHIKSLGNQLRIQRIRDEGNLPDPDWRELLRDLSAMTPSRQTWTTVVLEASTANFDKEKLLSSEHFGIRTIMTKSGCAITTDVRHAETEGSGETMTFTVYGPPRRLQSAVDLILNKIGAASLKSPPLAVVTPDSRKPRAKKSKAGKDHNAALDVEALTRHYGPISRSVRITSNDTLVVEDIPRPSKWTCENFDAYIKRITSPRLGHLAKKHSARRGHSRPHIYAVADILQKLFNDSEAMPFITLTSFHRALQFVKRFAPALGSYEIQLFWLASRNPNGLITTETFNILLTTHARLKDLGSVYRWIRLMHHFDCMPTVRTWLITLSLFESAEIKRYILHILDQKRLLESQTTVRQIAVLMLRHDTQLALEQGLTLDQMMARHDELYGGREFWLTRKGGLEVINVLCYHGRFDDAILVVSLMAAPDRPSSAKPNILTLNMLLTHAATHKLTRLALNVLATHCDKLSIQPDELTYKLLFDLFWKARMPLAVATVWHCAVLNGKADKLESWGPIGRALRTIKNLDSSPPVGLSEPSQQGMQLRTAMRLHSLLSPFVSSLTWYKRSEPVESEESASTHTSDQIASAMKKRPETLENPPDLDKETVDQIPYSVTADALLYPGFFQTYYAAFIRESESRLAARHVGYTPAAPLHVLLREAFGKDILAHGRISRLLGNSDESNKPNAGPSESQGGTQSSPEPRQSGDGAADITSTPSLAGIIMTPNIRDSLHIPLRRARSKARKPTPDDQIKLIADYTQLYLHRRIHADAAPAGQGIHP